MNWNLDNLTPAPLKPLSPETNVYPFEGNGGIQMNRYTIVEHVKARHSVVVWTASDLDRYWVYRPGQDCVESIGEGNWGLTSGVWVRGLAGMAALFPLFAGYFRVTSVGTARTGTTADDFAEWMLLGKVERATYGVSSFVSCHLD